jgi:hypothetical protein
MEAMRDAARKGHLSLIFVLLLLQAVTSIGLLNVPQSQSSIDSDGAVTAFVGILSFFLCFM